MESWMDARRIEGRGYFDRYQLESTRTISDYVVEQLHGVWREIRAHTSLALHPDKAESEAERALRNSCFKQLQVWLSHAAAMREIWASGQWVAAAPCDALRIESRSRVDSAPMEQAHLAEEGFRLSEPHEPLDLNVLELKEDYLRQLHSNFAQGVDARKRAREGISRGRRLHEGCAEDREFFEQFTQYATFVRQAAEEQRRVLAELREIKLAALQRLKDATCQKEAAIQQKEEARRQKEEARRQKEEERRQKEEARRQKEEAIQQNKDSCKGVISYLLGTKLSLECFSKVLSNERLEVYTRVYEETLAVLVEVFKHISIAELEVEMLSQLKRPEYNHLHNLITSERPIAVGENPFAMYSTPATPQATDDIDAPLLTGQRSGTP
jgi:hypothetical protein